MKISPLSKIAFSSLMALGLASTSQAALTASFQFNGNGNWSLDGVGSNNTPVGDITAIVPVGSTIVKAFLYSTKTANSPAAPTVGFDGTTINIGDWTSLGTNVAGGLTAFRRDVTAQVAAKVGGGSASPFTFTINSENPNTSIDGEALAIIYSNPAEQFRTIAFLDGFSNSAGDTATVTLGSALTAPQLADPNFEAQLSLGIGFGADGQTIPQFSQVDVNGVRLTSAAGGQNDGALANGALITIGGIGDSLANPANPFANTGDDELYSLKPFLAAGDTSIKIDTLNPSSDDNIFFAGINITAQAQVSTGVPDSGATIAMLALALTGIAGFRRKFAA